MKKRAFMAPLAVSLTALISAAPHLASAVVVDTATAVIDAGNAALPTRQDAPLVLKRANSHGITLAQDDGGDDDDGSHSSHDSHSSHESHSSHSSGDY